uniref:Putative reverse transcriptase and intron maturase n=1 Tax=Oedocladium carolinianum TaxID=55992 RepID=A0A1D8GXA4_9CHLO|nr:putative reverse transcriptase and intron maturase [Oedocladium carolinianum]AOT84346.1 putative reverse transcriptase and intron maturase [Oedocladium carolinianum]
MNKIDFINGTRCNTNRQSSIKWAKSNRIINNLKRRIFVAKQQGRLRRMRKLQKLLLTAHSNRLLAIQQVCQTNYDSEKSLAGQENRVFLTSTEKLYLVNKLKEIHLNKWKPMLTKIVDIPKYTGKLQVTYLTDRALQVVVKTALEPEWEAVFEKDGSAFSKEQSAQDVIQYIHNLYNAQSIKHWIVKVNIKNFFDSILKKPNFLNESLHSFPAKRLIQCWLNVGYMDKHIFYKGTLQGSIISNLLANIILHDMKKAFRISNNKIGHGNREIVHYANEFIVTCKTEEDSLNFREELNIWSHSRGLLINNIEIRHIMEGFNFLGFNIRLYNNGTRGKQKLIIKPSKKSVLKFKKKLKKMWIESNGCSVDKIINKFNPIIRSWANSFQIGNSSKIFKLLDHFMYRRQLCFTKRTHSRKSHKWIQQRYWGFLGSGLAKRYTVYTRIFGCKETGTHMLKLACTKSQRYSENTVPLNCMPLR